MKTLEDEKGTSILNYGLIVMSVTHTFTHVFGGIHTAIFSILREEFELSLPELGIIAAIPALCQALLAIPTGLFADRFGSKKTILISFIIATVGTLIASQSVNPSMFILAISLANVNSTIYHPASYSFTTKLFKSKDRPKAMGLHGAGGTLGHSLGPLLVSVLIGVLAFQWRQVYLLLAVPMILGIIMMFSVKYEPTEDLFEDKTEQNQTRNHEKLFNLSLMLFLGSSALRMFAGSMISTFLVLYLQDEKSLSLALASLVSGGTFLTGLVGAPLGGYLASRFGEKRWLLSAFALGYLFLGLSIAIPIVVWFTVFYLSYGFCDRLAMAARSSIMARLSPSKHRGLAFALFFLPGNLMSVISPIIAAFIAASFGYQVIFYISLGIGILALTIIKYCVKVPS